MFAQAQERIKWRTWEEVTELSKTDPRKVVVDIYTEWCGWCKKMDVATFQDELIVQYINDNYYAIKFDAEYSEPITYMGKTYEFIKGVGKKGKKGYHQLAAVITRGNLGFPSTVFLDEDLKVIQALRGFKDAETFEMIMTYFGKDHHKTTLWKVYSQNYKSISIPVQPVKN